MDGWRLFENSTGEDREEAKLKINRASNIFKDNVRYRITGKHLLVRRNLISHGKPINLNDGETLAFQMREFIHPYLIGFILNGFSFRSTKEFWNFLDLPPSKEKREREQKNLNRRLKLLKKAAIFRGEKDN